MSTTPNDDQPTTERRDLGNLLRRTQASRLLAELIAPTPATLLEFDGGHLTEISPWGAVFLRAAIDAHLQRSTTNHAAVIEPAESDCWDHLSDLMGRPSGRWQWAGNRSAAARGDNVFVPASTIPDQDSITNTALAVKVAASALGAEGRAPGLMAAAATAFLNNVWEHSQPESGLAVICASRHPPAKELQVVCFNLEQEGPSISNTDELRNAVQSPQGDHGSLSDLTALSHGGLDFSVRVMAGTGSGSRSSSRQRWDWREAAHSIPGFVSALEIKY